MTRLFLEIKNITLCAEPSFFILFYFLCKNLLFLCAEHHYPSSNNGLRMDKIVNFFIIWNLVFRPFFTRPNKKITTSNQLSKRSTLSPCQFALSNNKIINPVLHNVTPVAHGLKLVITRKINLKNFKIFFTNKL